MKIERWGVYLVDLNPPVGTKPGKIRPCVVVQDDALNETGHPSTVILPISSQMQDREKIEAASFLRFFIPEGEGGLEADSVVLVDQISAWDNRRFIKQIGELSSQTGDRLEQACRDFFGWSE
ncbi:MAG: type II toxin-antitoxin system PemK/MazF family toxin [Deltaproteobacteria bacterium]|nr:type II toxin-antitoxin system PemK/MazF family toxin [Deltaproteobacteria bacterium]